MTANLLMAAAAELLKFETAILLLVTVGLLVLAKMVTDLRGELRSLRSARPASPAAPAPAAVPSAAPVPAQSDEIPPHILAVIAAAVSVTLGHAHHVVSVTPAESLMWSREGRRNIFSSHSFR